MSNRNYGLIVESTQHSEEAKEHVSNKMQEDNTPKSAVSQSVKIFGYFMTVLYLLAVAGFIFLSYSLIL